MQYEKYLVLTSAVLLYCVMVVGAYLTTNPGYGLGCPNWPLCPNGVLPPLTLPALVEYTHRLLSAFSALFVVVSLIAVWRMKDRPSWALPSIAIATILLAIQIGLGGIVVESALNAVLTTAHLANAVLLFSFVLVAAVAMFRR